MIEHVTTLQCVDTVKSFGFIGMGDCCEKFVRFDATVIQPDSEMSLQKGDHPCQDR